MFGATHQRLKQYLIQNLSTHPRREGTLTMIAPQCTELHFQLDNYPPLSHHE